jgi:hypothetical protein
MKQLCNVCAARPGEVCPVCGTLQPIMNERERAEHIGRLTDSLSENTDVGEWFLVLLAILAGFAVYVGVRLWA